MEGGDPTDPIPTPLIYYKFVPFKNLPSDFIISSTYKSLPVIVMILNSSQRDMKCFRERK